MNLQIAKYFGKNCATNNLESFLFYSGRLTTTTSRKFSRQS